ncbi:DUF6686 family protein [Saccharicrinis aurantiacus]|uniref:DUF6686 family protein n=1 Tax=Saccharicrinis aurantiacus TaxID=1849719 RepID=UPI000838F4D5|nr:DUF6686 family protein [Saccharicrinis aurantiacus]
MDIKTLHGHIFTCSNCSKIHFEFNQFSMDFSNLDIVKDFKSYINQINAFKEEDKFRNNSYMKKIQIPFPRTSIKMVLSSIDLDELKILISTFVKDYEQELEEKKLLKKLSNIEKKNMN